MCFSSIVQQRRARAGVPPLLGSAYSRQRRAYSSVATVVGVQWYYALCVGTSTTSTSSTALLLLVLLGGASSTTTIMRAAVLAYYYY